MLPRGYTFDLVVRWGDSLFRDTPSLTDESILNDELILPGAAGRQDRQFGNNCDAVAFFPQRGRRGDAGVLCVNNEYVTPVLMFRGRSRLQGAPAELRREWLKNHPEATAVMKAAQGMTVVEVRKRRGKWQIVKGAPLNRRVTAETPIDIHGPARGSPLLRTKEDPEGVRVRGTFANCANGKTPWGTYLTCEENIDDYFASTSAFFASSQDAALRDAHRRFPAIDKGSYYGWEHVDPRFDMMNEPREGLRFGWVVEIDPHDPKSVPRKRTALGRFSHEGACATLAGDGRAAVYMGDDDEFEYVYKFVTRRAFDPRNPQANRDLLDEGTLYVARFDADGTGTWLPLVHDEKGPLNRASGFTSQADVVIKVRAAADLLGATPMDRPEGIQRSPVDGRLYISCTKNPEREAASRQREWVGRTIDVGPNVANPRGPNRTGIIEITEADGDAAAPAFRWDIFVVGGEPVAAGASPMACPDNLGFDPFGRLWIVTDADAVLGANDGCFVCPTGGADRGIPRQLMSAPVGAEVCGCEFTPDGTTLFMSIQHPGDGSTLEAPSSHWPDGGDAPPRSSVIAVRRDDGDPL